MKIYNTYQEMKQSDKKMPKNRIDRKDVFLAILLLGLCVVTKIPIFDYPIAGDSVVYLQLAESINQDQTYSIDGIPHTKYPPAWPILISIFLPLFKNPVWAIKIAGIFISSTLILLTFIMARILELGRTYSTICALLLLFNPWVFYFSGGFFPYSDGLAATAYVAACIFFLSRKKDEKYEYISAVFFALALITRVDMVFYIAPFLIFYGIKILKVTEIKKALVFIFVSLCPFGMWLIRNIFINSKIIGDDYGNILTLHTDEFPTVFLYISSSIILAMMALSPFIAYGIYKLIKNQKDPFWLMVLAGFTLHFVVIMLIDFITTDFVTYVVMRVRRSLIVLPIFTTSAILGVKYMRYKWKRYINMFFILLIPLYIIAAMIINYGFVQEKTSEIIDLGNTFTIRSYHRSQAIKWVNQNLERDATIIGNFDEDMSYEFVGNHFRDDLNYIDINDVKDMPVLDETYIITDYEKDTFRDTLSSLIGDVRLEQIHGENRVKVYNLKRDLKINEN